MAIIQCKECGNSISDRAECCIYCGCHVSENKAPVPKQVLPDIPELRPDAVPTKKHRPKHKKKVRVSKKLIGVFIAIAIIIIFVILIFTHTICLKHSYSEANVLESQTCYHCGKTKGEPKPLMEIEFPTKGVGSLLPLPESNMGEILWDDSNSFNAYVGNTTQADFIAYVQKCSDAGFDVDYQKGNDYYYSEDSSGNNLDIWYHEKDIMQIQIRESERVSVNSNNASSSIEETQTPVHNNYQSESSNTYRTDGFEYVILSDGTAEITKYVGSDSSVSISSIDGHDISSIGKDAFKNCASLSELWFSSNVTFIGESAFEGCTNIVDIDIKASSVGKAAFKDCTGLKELWFSSDVATIGKSAFEGCTSLIEVDVKAPTVDEAAFKGCTGIVELWFSTDVNSIGKSAFEDCSSLVEVDIKAPVVGDAAFKDCTSLAEIWFSSDVKSIGKSAFEGCTSLIEITGSTQNIEFDTNAFANCPNLKDLPDGIIVANTAGNTEQSETPDNNSSCDHQNREWKLVKDATLTTVGFEECFCTVCGESIDSRGTEKKNAKIMGESFNFGDIEFLDWMNELSTAEFSYLELGAYNNGNTSYPVTMDDGISGAIIFNHDDFGNISAIMIWFDEWENAAALAIWIGEKIDSDFSPDDAFVPIANGEVYAAADMVAMRLDLSEDMEVSVLAPYDRFDDII